MEPFEREFEISPGNQRTEDLGTYDPKKVFDLRNNSFAEDIQYYLAKDQEEYVTDRRTLRHMEHVRFDWKDIPDYKFLVMINNSGRSVSMVLQMRDN